MALALKCNLSGSQIEKDVQKQTEALNERILNSFIRPGEQFIIDAREQGQDHAMGQYKDITKALRNSISYHVFFNGKLVSEKVYGTGIENRQAIQDIINPKGFQLIGIAGMNYASFVESKGYNVISYQADVCMINLGHYLLKKGVIERESILRTEESFLP